MGLFRCLIIGAFILAVPLVLITTNIRLAVSQPGVYDYSVRHYDAATVSGIPEPELLRANTEIKRYLTTAAFGPLVVTVRDRHDKVVSLFNARETAHMADVRNLVRALFTVQAVSVAAVLTLAVTMLLVWPLRALAAAAFCGSLLTAGILALTAVVAALGFDSAWSQFHVLAFSNDLWKLNPDTDHLIQMFPQAFWERITLFVGLGTLLESVLISASAAGYLILSRPKAEPQLALLAPTLAGPAGRARPRVAPTKPRHCLG